MPPNFDANVLLVESDPLEREVFSAVLQSSVSHVNFASSVGEAFNLLGRSQIDLVLSDQHFQDGTGIDLLARMKVAEMSADFILMAREPQMDEMLAALRLKAFDLLVKPPSLSTLTGSVERCLREKIRKENTRNGRGKREVTLSQRTYELGSALTHLTANDQTTLESLVAALDLREHETLAHSFRVQAYAMHLAKIAGYPSELMPQLEYASLLHDIGKIAIPDSILLKPGRLTEAETETMKQHASIGAQILSSIPFLKSTTPIVRHHHERYNGQGYPDGLMGEEIPVSARLFAIVDTFDAMTAERCYRPTPGLAAAKQEIQQCAGTQFDPRLARVFAQVPDAAWMRIRSDITRRHSARHPIFTEAAAGAPVVC